LQITVPPSIAVILAAGLGTRLKSQVPKPLHRLGGRPMVRLLLDACEAAGFGRIVVVAGPEPSFDPMRAAAAPHAVVVQAERLGTAHAALMAEEALGAASGEAIILYGDVPLVSAATLSASSTAKPRFSMALPRRFRNASSSSTRRSDGSAPRSWVSLFTVSPSVSCLQRS
jgi:bifunctional UDP-N-acetylglucosamine pyrophosphorylase/glucosamine-1-phosphate N-acetyltransferase